jgi:hypothetical protein
MTDQPDSDNVQSEKEPEAQEPEAQEPEARKLKVSRWHLSDLRNVLNLDEAITNLWENGKLRLGSFELSGIPDLTSRYADPGLASPTKSESSAEPGDQNRPDTVGDPGGAGSAPLT